jgi:hypothetical protein
MQINNLWRDNASYLVLAAVIFLIFGVYLRFEALEAVRITEWVTRDFDRAFHLFDGDYIPLAGPERNAGGRLLGPFLYVFLAIPLFFDYSYDSIFVFNFILNVASVLFFAGFVWKYFGVITAAFATILLSVNLVHLDSSGFPINPTFMFPLIFVFFFFLFKLSFERDAKYLPLVLVVISLGIQMHFSLATYYLAPFLALAIFKIKINRNDIFKTLLLISVCFLPYVIYKQSFYEITIKITEPFFNQEFNFLKVFKIITLQNLFYRINQDTSLFNFYLIPKFIPKIGFIFSYISFWGLVIYSIVKLRKNDFDSCKREILLLLVFYFPALIYEITNPPTLWHFWHYFIFIVPLVLIKARFLFLLLQVFKKDSIKNLTCSLIILAIGSETYIKFEFINKYNSDWSQSFKSGGFYNPKQIKFVFQDLMEKLSLTPEEFFTNVYWDGESIQPVKLTEPKRRNSQESFDQSVSDKPCYYIVPRLPDVGGAIGIPNEAYERLNNLFTDNTIHFDKQNIIFLPKFGSVRMNRFVAFPYTKKYDQPCYTNFFNPFMVESKTRDYLKESSGINKKVDGKTVYRELSKQEKFDSNSSLDYLEKTLIFFNPELNIPVKVQILIDKKGDKYRLHSDIFYYSWGKKFQDLIHIKKLDLQIVAKKLSDGSRQIQLPIIDEKAWIAKTPGSIITENFHWYKKIELPINTLLKKEKFKIKLAWVISFPHSGKTCCFEFVTNHLG